MTSASLGLPIVDKTDPTQPQHGHFLVIGEQLQTDAHNYVWDPIGLVWVRETQPGGSGGGGTSSAFGAPFPAAGTAAGAKDINANMGPLLLDANGYLFVNVAAGAGGGGVAQTQVRSAGNVWTDVGYFAGNLTMPISAATLPLPVGAMADATFTARFPAAVLYADTLASPTTTEVITFPMLWNGVFNDRLRAAGTAADTAGMGVLAAGIMGFDEVATLFRRIAASASAPAGTEKALIVRNIPSGTQDVNVTDRAARLVGIMYGDQGQLLQRVATRDLQVQLRAAATEYDAREVFGIAFGAKPAARATVSNIDASTNALDVTVAGTVAVTSAQLPSVLIGGRLDTNIGAWMGSVTPTVGQKIMASSLPIVIASDQSGVPVVGDVDHDAVDTLKTVQTGGFASPSNVPPVLVSANADRARIWVDRAGAQIMRRRKLRESFTAWYRLAEAAARLDPTFTHVANTNKQYATLHHLASATREVRIMQATLWILNVSVATQGMWELRRITTAPATGNPAITPSQHDQGSGATECVALTLPTTAGTEAAVNSPYGGQLWDLGVTGAASIVNPPALPLRIPIYDASAEDDEEFPPIIRAGLLEGYAIVGRTVGIPVVRFFAMIRYTEEVV